MCVEWGLGVLVLSLGLLLAATADVTRAGTALALPGVRERTQLNSISIKGHRKAEEGVI